MKSLFVLLSVVLSLVLGCTSGVYAQSTRAENEVPDSLVKACYANDTGTYFPCLDALNERYKSLYTQGAVFNAKGKFLLRSGMYDRCIEVAQLGLTNANKQDNDINRAVFNNLLGACYQMKGDQRTAIDKYINAAIVLEKSGDTLRSALIKNNVANIYYDLKDYQSAQQYIVQAYKDVLRYKDTPSLSRVICLMATIQLVNKDTANAFNNSKEALNLSRAVNNIIGEVTAMSTIANVYYYQGKYDSSFFYYRKTDSLSTAVKLTHFSIIAKAGLINIYNKRSQYQQAIQTANEALTITAASGDDKGEAKLYRPYAIALYNTGNYKTAYEYLNYSYEANDSMLSMENKEVVNNITIKYETAKKDKEIAQNKLKIAKQSAQLYERNMFLIALVLVLILLLLLVVLLRMRNKYKLQQVTEQKRIQVLQAHVDGEEKERTRLAKELHDGIANELAVIKLNLENLNEQDLSPEKTSQLSKLASVAANAHAELRRVSHNLYPVRILKLGLPVAVKEYLQGLPTSGCTVHVTVVERGEVYLPVEQQLLVFRLVQEIVTNAVKHSEAVNITVDMLISLQTINLTVDDDGVGLPESVRSNSASFVTIQESVDLLGGNIDIDSRTQEGTTITISIPNEKQ